MTAAGASPGSAAVALQGVASCKEEQSAAASVEPCRCITALPAWRRVLAVGAHPDDETFGLGAVLAAFVEQDTAVGVISLTHGEASTLGTCETLGSIRGRELAAAAGVLGIEWVKLLGRPDGRLDSMSLARLVGDIELAIHEFNPDGLLVFDLSGITGHPDHQRATRAALAAASKLNLPVLAWVLPASVAGALNQEFGTSFAGRSCEDIGFSLRVDRSKQLAAIARHESQCTDNPVLWRRLELLGDREWLHCLRRPTND